MAVAGPDSYGANSGYRSGIGTYPTWPHLGHESTQERDSGMLWLVSRK